MNPAVPGLGRIEGAKVTGAKLYASDFRAADMPDCAVGKFEARLAPSR